MTSQCGWILADRLNVRFPATNNTTDEGRGIGSHTDYGLLVIAAQDDVGGERTFNLERECHTYTNRRPVYPSSVPRRGVRKLGAKHSRTERRRRRLGVCSACARRFHCFSRLVV